MDDLPTTAFVNAALFDGHRYRGPLDGAVLVEGGRISGIGEPPAGATVVDAGGGLLAPGFVDAHVHAVQGGMELTRCNLAEGSTREEYLATIAAYARSHPDEPWILGGGWAMAAFPGGTPTAADLDEIVPDRPVFLPNRDHHGAWVNTRAMEIAGIRRDSPEPPHGRYERDADGVPTGTLHEGAMDVVTRHAPGPPTSSTTPACWRARPTCTPWGSPAGRTRSSGSTPAWTTPDRPTSRPRSAVTSPRTWSARSGGTATPARSRSSRWSSAGARSPTAGSAPPASR